MIARAGAPVAVGLLGYGTVGAAVDRLLVETGDEIERATGHRPYVKQALVRELGKERPGRSELLTDDFAAIRDDPDIQLVAEVMGGVEQAYDYVAQLLAAGKSVVTANKQLMAQRGRELFALAHQHGGQLRLEASVCAAIPVVKVLRESLVASHVRRVLGIVNGTTNFVLTRMEAGASYAEALAEAQRLGYAEADPSDDVSGADAAAKMALLATIAFGSRVDLADVSYRGITTLRPEHVQAAARLGAVVRLVGQATLVPGAGGPYVDVRVSPALVPRGHPLAAVEGAMNAVMLVGDAIREVTLAGPGAGGVETASAVVADLVSVLGSQAGFLQDDPCWRALPALERDEFQSAFYLRLEVQDHPGVLAQIAASLSGVGVSVASLQQEISGGVATLDVVTHVARQGDVEQALRAISSLPEARQAELMRVVDERGI